jgi:hypothetical protein
MLKHIGLVLKGFLLLLVSLFYMSCSGTATSSSFDPSITTAPTDALPGTSNGASSVSNFFISVDSNINSIAHVHDATGFSTKCAIDPSESKRDIECVIEVPEAELFMNGLGLGYNIPPNMCRYLKRKTYWYYDKEVGTGPSSIVINKTVNASGDLTASSCTVDGVANAGCTPTSEVTINVQDETVSCVYDKSSVGSSNCCMGNRTLTVNTLNSGTGLTNISTSPGSWGANLATCIGGAGKNSWSAVSSTGLPISLVEKTKAGVTGTYILPAPISTSSFSSNIEIANYHNQIAGTHTHTGFGPALVPPIATRASNLPYFVDPIDDRNGTLVTPGNGTYDFECLDEGFETLHRIRVRVREWDTYLDYAAYISSAGVTENPDRGFGTEELGNCQGIAGPCNDMYDLDDFVNLILGGPYNMGAGAISNRANYFPQLYP